MVIYYKFGQTIWVVFWRVIFIKSLLSYFISFIYGGFYGSVHGCKELRHDRHTVSLLTDTWIGHHPVSMVTVRSWVGGCGAIHTESGDSECENAMYLPCT